MQKFQAIESLRGWMAWWVVIGHAFQLVGGGGVYIAADVAKWLERGALAVQVFMIVSGFVICHLLISKKETYRLYIARRWFRLFPLFIVSASLAVISRDLYVASFIDNPWAVGADMRLERLAAEKEFWLPHLVAHLTLLHGLIPTEQLRFASSTFLAPAWSLSLEWQFYLLAPLLLIALTHKKQSIIAVIFIILSYFAMSGYIGHWQYQSFILLALPFFLGGMASRLLLERVMLR